MPVYSPRNRLVNFRVNDEEYRALRKACAEAGARSISDFARLAILRHLDGDERASPDAEPRLALLWRRMAELERRVAYLLRRLEEPPGAERREQAEREEARS